MRRGRRKMGSGRGTKRKETGRKDEEIKDQK